MHKGSSVGLALTPKGPRALAMVFKGMFLAYWQHKLFWHRSVYSDAGSRLRFHIFHSYGHGERNISIIFDNLPSTLPLLWYYFLNYIFRKKGILIINWQLLPVEIHILKVSACPFLVDFRAEMGLQKELHLRKSTRAAQAILILLFQDFDDK